MKPRKIPMRMCVGCREMKPKKELLRVVKTPEGEILLDFSGKVSGRGAYVCPNKECLERAVKQKQLDRALEVVLDDEVIKDLEKALEKTTPIKGDKA
ncbi:MAG: YlxR family protein [Clostridiales bacterium]|nr:YlxR family protein [Clostridiales bacterium]